jgi:hypothetical protein
MQYLRIDIVLVKACGRSLFVDSKSFSSCVAKRLFSLASLLCRASSTRSCRIAIALLRLEGDPLVCVYILM